MVTVSFVRRSTPLFREIEIDPTERAQVERILRSEDVGSIEAARKSGEWGALEVVDVHVEGALAYRLVLYPSGNGVLFEGTSTRALVDIAQHHAEVRPGVPPELADALVAALARDGARLGVVERFEHTRQAPKATPTDEALLSAVEPKNAAGERLSDDEVDALHAALLRVVGKREKPVAPSELSPLGRRLVIAMAKGGAYHHKKLGALGLPIDAGGLLVLAGERDATGVQRLIVVNGVRRSILEHARRVAKGALDGEACIDAIVALGEPSALDVLRRLLRFDREERMTSFPWGVTEEAAARWLARLANRLGAAGQAVAAELVQEDLGSGRYARLFVWANTAPNIDSTPRPVAAQLRALWGPDSSPQTRADAAPLLADILARLPDREKLVAGVVTHVWYPPGEPVKGIHKGSGFVKADPAGLAAARGSQSPALLDDVARLFARATMLGKAFASVAAESRAVMVEAGAAGRDALDRVAASEPDLANHLAAAKIGRSPAASAPAKAPATKPAGIAPKTPTRKTTTTAKETAPNTVAPTAKKKGVKKAPPRASAKKRR